MCCEPGAVQSPSTQLSFTIRRRIVKEQSCTAPLNLWTDRFSFATNPFIKKSVASEAPVLKRHPGALVCDSVERASPVFRCNGF